MSYSEDAKKKKRFAVIGVSSFLLVAMVVAVTVGVGLEDGHGDSVSDSTRKSTKEVSASVKAIKSICQPTDYRKTCESSLQKTAGNTTDPKELIKAAFKAAKNNIAEAAKKSALLNEAEKDPRTNEALQGCRELMNMSMAELQHSIEKFSDFDITRLENMMADLKTWLSASITYQVTCLDGFENTTTDAGEKMKSLLKTSMELSSNGLDIVSGLSNVVSQLQISGLNRRLLEDVRKGDYPSWVDQGTRRLLASSPSNIKPTIVVAQDGSGDFKTIRAALDHMPKKSDKTTVIYIKAGVYKEYIEFARNMTNLVVIGDGPTKTRITGSKNFIEGITTYHTATVVVQSDNFVAKDIGFENSAGPEKHQAVALRVSADYTVFYNCAMDGYQDTLYAHAKRQFYRDCTISGTIDFVFGDAVAVFQNCKFLVRKPMKNQQNIITAQGRKQRRQPSAIIIQNGTLTAHPDLYPERKLYRTYLGRPWKEFSRTVIMESYIDDLIQPEGWLPWEGTFGLKTCWYGEYNNYGPGAAKAGRVRWNGIKTITPKHAMDFTPGRFLKGDSWIKPTGVPYTPYLTRKVA